MPGSGLWLRAFLGLLLAILPPLLLLVGALLLTDTVLAEADPDLVALFVMVGSIVWAAVLAVVYARSINEDVRSLVSLAQRGDPDAGGARDDAYRSLASSLEERNRQVGTLARVSREMAIDQAPRAVVLSLVESVATVMRDPTWSCAVLASSLPELLPVGVYASSETGGEANMTPIGDLERWAAVASHDADARTVEGPWGAFAVVDVVVENGAQAILYAPWEGRAAPSRSELDLLLLIGQHAEAALEHSLLYARLQVQTDELNRLAAIQADFLRGVTHDLQTPLTSIGALAVELEANVDMPSDARMDLDSIAHQAERLRRVVSQLLVASRLEAGAVHPVQDVFAVRPLIERTWRALRADRPFDLAVDGPSQLAIGDQGRVEQVLWAVLDNAVKYSPAGSAVEVSVEPDGDRMSIAVRDHGTGMDGTTRERAFEQFYRSPDARRLAPDGSGIGLYAARGLMQAMGGEISLDSRLGDGTTVVVTIPAESSGDEPR